VRFALLMYADPDRTRAMTAAERAEVAGKHDRLWQTWGDRIVGGDGLAFPEQTRTLRWRGDPGEGPFLAGREQLTAYYVVDGVGHDEALALAEELLDFHVVAVEVRAVHDSVDRRRDEA
jgi:hypothetical protein